MTFYVTFGQSHVHRFNGVTLDRDSVIRVNAPTESSARRAVFRVFGEKWGAIYSESQATSAWWALFPRGQMAVLDAVN